MPTRSKTTTKTKKKTSSKTKAKTVKKAEPKKKRGRPKTAKSKGGRPTKLTAATKKIIVDALRAGNYVETVAPLAGLNRDTIYDWLKRGARAQDLLDKGKEVPESEMAFVDFSNEVKEAMAQSEVEDLKTIEHASKDPRYWQAAAWRLERRFHKKWGKKADHVVLVGELTEERERELQDMFDKFIEEDK